MIKKIAIKGFTTINRSFGNFGIYNIDCAKRDLLNHFYTRRGTRVMMPTFGSIIPNLIFDPQTEETEDLINEDVRRIVSLDPRFNLNDIAIDSYDNGYNVNLNLTYVPTQELTDLTINFDTRSENAREL
jgi:phage baseplate assembly protein W